MTREARYLDYPNGDKKVVCLEVLAATFGGWRCDVWESLRNQTGRELAFRAYRFNNPETAKAKFAELGAGMKVA